MKLWNMPTYVPTRKACAAPWVALADMAYFLAFCDRNGIKVRGYIGGESTDYQIRHQGDWMAMCWNQASERYSADRRLAPLVQKFAVERAHNIK